MLTVHADAPGDIGIDSDAADVFAHTIDDQHVDLVHRRGMWPFASSSSPGSSRAIASAFNTSIRSVWWKAFSTRPMPARIFPVAMTRFAPGSMNSRSP